MAELERYTGNVWTHIISLKREDAARLGYDNAAARRNLIRAHRNDIAAAMKMPPADFRWYAAFHDEGEHPRFHLMAWSAKPGKAYLSKEGIRQIKSKLTNDIFRNEMLHPMNRSQSQEINWCGKPAGRCWNWCALCGTECATIPMPNSSCWIWRRSSKQSRARSPTAAFPSG